MSLFDRTRFETFVVGLPAAELVHQWGDASVGKIGGKIFAILSGSDEEPRLSFKCSDMAFELLPDLRGLMPAPYLARAKWVAAEPECELTADELADYVREAHRLVACKLTASQKVALNLGAYLANR